MSLAGVVLVPHQVVPNMIVGAIVSDEAARDRTTQTGFSLPVVINPDFYFR